MLRHYTLLYREFLRSCFAEALTYRINFILLVLLDVIFYATSLAGVDFIFLYVDQIGPWGRHQFLFFISFMLAVDHLHMTFISEGFWNLSHEIRTGKLDFILIKPVGTWFPIFFRHIRIGSLLVAPLPWLLMFYFGKDLNLTVLQWAMMPALVVFALAFLVIVEITISMAMFWTIESWGINFLRMQLQQLSRWPVFVFDYATQKFFSFVIPVLMIGSVPVGFTLGYYPWPMLLVMLGVMVVFGGLASVLWRAALRRYESASS